MNKLLLPAVVIAAITLASCARPDIAAEPAPAEFALRHILSQIDFKALPPENAPQGVTVKITGLDITRLQQLRAGGNDEVFTAGKESASLLLVPQEIPAEAFSVKLNYSITTTDDDNTGTTHHATTLSLPEVPLPLEQGKQYTFVLTLIPNEGLMSTQVTLADWESGGELEFSI